MFLIGTLAAFVMFQFATLLYIWLQGVVGRLLGATIEQMSLGIGPVLYSRRLNGTEWCISGIPLGGYTKFFGHDATDQPSLDETQLRFDQTSVVGRMFLHLVGPLSNGLLGVLLMGIPVLMEARQAVVDPAAETLVASASIPHLGLASEKSSIEGQRQFFRATFVEYWRGWHMLDGDSWGGLFSSFVTCGLAGTYDLFAWMTCTGVILIGIMIMNLLPVPILNGGHFIILLPQLFGLRMPDSVVQKLHVVGIFFVLGLMINVCISDVKWIATHLLQLFS